MLSNTTHSSFLDYAEQAGYSEVELAEAIRLYCSDFTEIWESPNNTLTKSQITNSLITQTNLGHLFGSASTNVQANAANIMASKIRSSSIREGFISILLSIVANVIFVALSILFYLAIRETAEDALSKISPPVETITIQTTPDETDTKEGEPAEGKSESEPILPHDN